MRSPLRPRPATARRIAVLLLIAATVLALVQVHEASAQASVPDVVVSEIAWMGTSGSTSDEWIELYNNTVATITLSGWSLVAGDGSPTIPLSGAIPPGGYFLLERTDDGTLPGVAADLLYTGGLENDGESLTLLDGAVAVDRVPCDAGWFAGHSDARVPMARVDTTASGEVAGHWTYAPRCGTPTNSAGISATCELTTTTLAEDLDWQVYFNPTFTATTTSLTASPMETHLLSLINGAGSSIYAALYGLSRQSVVDALIAAHGRGVTVRVVGDDEGASGPYSASYQALTDAGVPVVVDSDPAIQHNKFLIVDGEVVWTGSTNLTDTGFTMNANNAIVVTSTALADVYALEFDEMWGGVFHGDKADNTLHLFDYAGTALESYFSPTDLVAFEVWRELAAADETVHSAMFFWTDSVLTEQAIERIDAGVEFYGVWDNLGAASDYSADDALCAAGARIGVEAWAGKLHHKFAVIDVHGSDPTVILGSYNWTDSGAYENDENTLVIHDAALAQAYYEEWQRLWGAMDLENICNPYMAYLPLAVIGTAPLQ
jgi:hypothetical protein